MVEFNWLHLTDLHLGMRGSEELWPYVEDDFLNDLRRFVKNERGPQLAPLDFVVFTGDLVQSGGADQFEEIDAVLVKLWKKFSDEMEFEPKLLVVPGNHDLTRPAASTGNNPNPALDTLTHLWHLPHVYDAFWDPYSPQRELVSRAFTNFVDWWRQTSIPKPELCWEGELPGDFSATIEKDGVKLGIVGLNSTFLQLTDGDHEGKLALSQRQFNLACGGHGPDWAAAHNLSLLLTHHPPEWLSERAQEKLVEIHKPPRFALHLFGHVHEANLSQLAQGGAKPLNRLQGSSLFSFERSSSGSVDRRHGYSLGQLRIEDRNSSRAELRIWPRSANRIGDGPWQFQQDNSGRYSLDVDSGTEPTNVDYRPRPGLYTYPADEWSDAGEETVVEPVSSNDARFQTIGPAITARDPILIARLDMLQQKLSRIPRWLESTLERLEVEKSFKKTLLDENIGRPLRRQENALLDIYRNLRNLDTQDKQEVSGAIKAAWSGYNTIYLDSQQIFSDCLELMGGLALRDTELDERICEVADELINATTDYVRTSWYSFTILAQREAFQWTISRIIRLRFPEWTIWSLPFAANEFGHVVINDKGLFEDILDEQDYEWQKRQLNVVLADAFATYVMGPAYVCAAISLWLNPLEPDDGAAFSSQANEVGSDYTFALGIRGAVLYALQRYGEALEALDRVLSVDQDNAFALETKGLVLRALRQDQQAEEVFSRAAALDPELTGAHAGLEDAWRILGRNKKLLEETLGALDRELATHLSDATRARVMFAVLERMDRFAKEDIDENPYEEMIGLLKGRWRAALGQQDDSSELVLVGAEVWDDEELRSLVDKALRELDDWLLEHGMYPHRGSSGIEVAEEWAAAWQAQLDGDELLSVPDVSAQSTLRDALNAAWLCRIQGKPDAVDEIAQAAYQLCKKIIDRKDADADEPVAVHSPPLARRQRASRRLGR